MMNDAPGCRHPTDCRKICKRRRPESPLCLPCSRSVNLADPAKRAIAAANMARGRTEAAARKKLFEAHVKTNPAPRQIKRRASKKWAWCPEEWRPDALRWQSMGYRMEEIKTILGDHFAAKEAKAARLREEA